MLRRVLGNTRFFLGSCVFAWACAWACACTTAGLKVSGTGASGSGGPPEDEGDAAVSAPVDPNRDPAADLDGGTLAVSSAVTVQVLPNTKGAPDLLAAIRGAKKSVHMTMYLLNDSAAIKALTDVKAAGKEVKVVLNKEFPPNGGDNQEAYDDLVAKGVSVVWAPSAYKYTHAKSLIIDGEKLIVMTMNLTYTSPRTNREFIATDLDPGDVADAEKLFQADFTNAAVSVTAKLLVSPKEATPIEPRARLRALVNSAKTSLDVEVQSLSDTALVDAIVLAHQAGVAVRVVLDLDTLNTDGQQAALAKLKENGVPVVALAAPDIHAKVIIADGLVFIGSQNMTRTALEQNREMGLITDAPAEVAKVRNAIATDFAAGTVP